jgi:hypothetical protein
MTSACKSATVKGIFSGGLQHHTACSNTATVNRGDVVKFPNVESNYGIQNMTLFKQTGIFTCEQKGLYTKYAAFRWYLNNLRSLTTIYVSNHSIYQSGSGMVTLEIAVGDTVSLKSVKRNTRIDPYSCYTLIKIK